MPGLLSTVFADDGGADTQAGQVYDASGDAGIDLSPTISVGHDTEGSYQNLDGSTTNWTSETDVTLSVDVAATLGAAGAFDQQSDAGG